ncbi:MAG: NAD-dependent epimerase/dehydratase family protein [Planctomycetaceae bacterium]|jgi:UDP-glucose 4-epimerase|nr:NAD-dependent epimerase/dehydratase family protein [Planctomycetaceae bacterium]
MTNHKHVALVTGAAGFLGSHVAEHCLSLGLRVIGIDDLSGGFESNVPKGVEFHHGSVCDKLFVQSLFAKHAVDYVYHLAAYAAEGLSHFIRHFNYENNLQGSILLINEAVLHDVKCFVFTSSIAVYGTGQTPMTETLVPVPEDPYGISKYAVELDLKAAHHMFGLNSIVFRPHNVYGERQNTSDRYRNVIGIFMQQARTGQPMSVFGDGLQTRAFSHVDDVAPIIASAPLVPAAYNETFNVGADTPYTVLALAEEVARAFDITPNIVHLPARNEVVHAFSDHSKVRRVFAPPPCVELGEGIRRMAKWTRTQPLLPPTSFGAIEVRRNLPPSWQA